ncbi:MAG TPA: c(7)-type cytochrome triheme domain-containing protein [Burkholderiales bacterium]|nr:c(7)-type cytochrome triheme domain-containing protein [Burkholderiales bacterium]
MLRKWHRQVALALAGLTFGLMGVAPGAHAEYGDVVINNYSDAANMRPVVFPHWFHRVRFRCKVCHADLGFKMKAGGNEINMVKIIDGEYCGACHNGEIAWSVENCNLCHSAKPGTVTQVHESTLQKLVAPGAAVPAAPAAPAASSAAPKATPAAPQKK